MIINIFFTFMVFIAGIAIAEDKELEKELMDSFPTSMEDAIIEDKPIDHDALGVERDLYKNTDYIYKNYTVVQALNKITTKASKFKIKVKEEVKFGNLTIHSSACLSAAPGMQPENMALFNIYEQKQENTEKTQIFKGWMLSSSPGVTSFNHPVYDIILLECINE